MEVEVELFVLCSASWRERNSSKRIIHLQDLKLKMIALHEDDGKSLVYKNLKLKMEKMRLWIATTDTTNPRFRNPSALWNSQMLLCAPERG